MHSVSAEIRPCDATSTTRPSLVTDATADRRTEYCLSTAVCHGGTWSYGRRRLSTTSMVGDDEWARCCTTLVLRIALYYQRYQRSWHRAFPVAAPRVWNSLPSCVTFVLKSIFDLTIIDPKSLIVGIIIEIAYMRLFCMSCQSLPSPSAFKRELKTVLFIQSYPESFDLLLNILVLITPVWVLVSTVPSSLLT